MIEMDSTQFAGDQVANLDSSANAVQPNSFDPAKFEERLMAKVTALLADPRTTQSVKDKALAEIRKDKGLKDFLAEYKTMKASGMTDEQIEMEARLREMENKISAPEQQSRPGKDVADQQNPIGIFASSIGLQNDPEATAIMSGEGNLQDKMVAMAELYAKRKSTNPNPALVAQPAGGSVPPVNIALLEAQYKQEVMANRGNKNAILNIKNKYSAQGLDVSRVSF